MATRYYPPRLDERSPTDRIKSLKTHLDGRDITYVSERTECWECGDPITKDGQLIFNIVRHGQHDSWNLPYTSECIECHRKGLGYRERGYDHYLVKVDVEADREQETIDASSLEVLDQQLRAVSGNPPREQFATASAPNVDNTDSPGTDERTPDSIASVSVLSVGDSGVTRYLEPGDSLTDWVRYINIEVFPDCDETTSNQEGSTQSDTPRNQLIDEDDALRHELHKMPVADLSPTRGSCSECETITRDTRLRLRIPLRDEDELFGADSLPIGEPYCYGCVECGPDTIEETAEDGDVGTYLVEIGMVDSKINDDQGHQLNALGVTVLDRTGEQPSGQPLPGAETRTPDSVGKLSLVTMGSEIIERYLEPGDEVAEWGYQARIELFDESLSGESENETVGAETQLSRREKEQ